MLRLLVFGSRNWVWQSILWRVLDQELAQVEGGSDNLLIIQGDARISRPAAQRSHD